MKKILSMLLIMQSITCDPFWMQSPVKANEIIKSMTLREKIGQLFMLGVFSYDHQPDKSMVEEIIKEYHIGGLIFMSGNAKKQVELANYYQSISKYPLIYAQDNEWGRVTRHKELVKFPNSMTMGAINGEEEAYSVGIEFAKRCKNLGIHLNFAPVVDINNNPNNPVINDRSFGQDKENVTKKAMASMQGMQDGGIVACAKHFPGHGDTNIDSHLKLPVVNKPKSEIDALELYPYKEMIDNGLQVIMTSHIHFPQIDSKVLPATVSHNILTSILREELGFKGVVVTDSMNMLGISSLYPKIEHASLQALMAGSDIILFAKGIADKNQKNRISKSIELIYQSVINGEITENFIDDKVRRVLMLKQSLGLIGKVEPTPEFNIESINNTYANSLIEKIYDAAMTLAIDKNKYIPISSLEAIPTALVSIGNDNGFASKLKFFIDFEEFSLPTDALSDDIQNVLFKINDAEMVIIALHETNNKSSQNWGISLSTIDFINKVEKNKIVIVFGSPYIVSLLKNENCIIIAYDDNIFSYKSVSKVIGGSIEALGSMPVSK